MGRLAAGIATSIGLAAVLALAALVLFFVGGIVGLIDEPRFYSGVVWIYGVFLSGFEWVQR